MKTTRTNMSGLSDKYDVDFDPKWHVDLDESDYDQKSARRASSILTDSSSPSEPQIPKWRLISLYVSICLGLFLSFLDTSIIATAIYTIGVEFKSLSKVHWIALCYTLAYIGCTAIFASLSDVFGRRNVYIAAAVIFLATSIGCGCAQTLDQLIALRTLQGVGGSGLYSVGFVILPEISSLRMVRMIGAIAGAVIAMSGILGPVVGGLITEYTTWRWIFWINAPLGIVPLVLFTVAYPNTTQLRPLQRRSLKQVDYFGFFLLLAAAVPLVFSFQEAGMKIIKDTSIWKSPLFIAPIAASFACFMILFGWEWFISKRWPDVIGALFPMRLAKNKVYISAVLVTMLTGFPYFIVIYSLPVRYQVVNGVSALKAGLALLPMLGSSAVGSTLAGAASGKRNNTFPVMVVGAALMLIGTATLTTLKNVVTPQARSYGLQVFVGFGYGLTVSNSGLIAGLTAELRDAATAQGIIAQVRMLGGSIGIAASSAILGVKQRQLLLATGVLSPHQMESLAETMHTLFPQQVFAVRQAYTDAFNETLTVCAIVTGVALLATMGGFQKNPPTMEQRRREQYENEAMRQRLIGEEKARAAALKRLQGS